MRANDFSKPIEAWANRHWPALSVLGYLLAFAATFGGVALAAYHSGFSATAAVVCGALAILFIRSFARRIAAAQRLIDRLHPPAPDESARPDAIPGWAVALYALIGGALILLVIATEDTYTYAVTELFVAGNAGRYLLGLFWPKRDGTTAFDAFDHRLDAWAAEHRPLLAALGTAACFALLFGGVMIHAYESGFAAAAAAKCGAHCRAIPAMNYLAAAACGPAAIVFINRYPWLRSA